MPGSGRGPGTSSTRSPKLVSLGWCWRHMWCEALVTSRGGGPAWGARLAGCVCPAGQCQHTQGDRSPGLLANKLTAREPTALLAWHLGSVASAWVPGHAGSSRAPPSAAMESSLYFSRF